MRTRIITNSGEPLTAEQLQKIAAQFRNTAPVCPKCGHVAHRAYRCGAKTVESKRTCDCNVTFEVNNNG